MQLEERFNAIRAKVDSVLSLANKLYGVDIKPELTFNLTGRVAGFASCRICRITGNPFDLKVRFNRQIIAGKHFPDMLDNTVPHEIAHLVTYVRPELGHGHDDSWRKICVALGGNGQTRHNMEVTHRGGSFVYRATCGTLVTVSKIIHDRIQAGTYRVLRKTRGQINPQCAWAPQGQPLPDTPQSLPKVTMPTRSIQQPVTITRNVKTTKNGELTWAEKVRRLISTYKPQGSSQDAVINLAITNLGMTKERARSCVKAHWDKV